jgi:uncharacterized DUF497 family protein
MRFEWDETKRRANLRQHGLDFLAVERIFAGVTITALDDRFDYGEIRFLTIGVLNGRVVAVTHTETVDLIRVISLRKASRREEESYYKEING